MPVNQAAKPASLAGIKASAGEKKKPNQGLSANQSTLNFAFSNKKKWPNTIIDLK